MSDRRMRRLLILALASALVLLGGVFLFDRTLPDNAQITSIARHPTLAVVHVEGDERRLELPLKGGPVALDRLPAHLHRTVIAIEDPRFERHRGLDPLAVADALGACLRDLVASWSCRPSGGSTITQQVAKNLFLSQERTLWRKLRELVLALRLERLLGKDELLEIYLNLAHFGQNLTGIESAARFYFQKPATRLNLWESAMLVGLLPRPRELNPKDHPERAMRQAEAVLERLVAAGVVEAEEARAARAEGARPGATPLRAITDRSFTHWQALAARPLLGRLSAGDRVHLTLDPALQIIAERLLEETGRPAAAARALVAMAPDGAVRAMVGGRAWRDAVADDGRTLLELVADHAATLRSDSALQPFGIFAARTPDGRMRHWRMPAPVQPPFRDVPLRADAGGAAMPARIAMSVVGRTALGSWFVGHGPDLVIGLLVEGAASEGEAALRAQAVFEALLDAAGESDVIQGAARMPPLTGS